MSLILESRKPLVVSIDDSPKWHDIGWESPKPSPSYRAWVILAVVAVGMVWFWMEAIR